MLHLSNRIIGPIPKSLRHKVQSFQKQHYMAHPKKHTRHRLTTPIISFFTFLPLENNLIKTFKLWPKVSEGKMAKKSLKIQLKIQFEVLQFICSNEFEELQWYTDQVFFIIFFFYNYNFRVINVMACCDLV